MILSTLSIPNHSWPHPRWALPHSELGTGLEGDGDHDPEHPEHPNPLLASLQGFFPHKRWEKSWEEMETVILSIQILSCFPKKRFPRAREGLGAVPGAGAGLGGGTWPRREELRQKTRIPGGSLPVINGSKL